MSEEKKELNEDEKPPKKSKYVRFSREFQDSLLSTITRITAKLLELENRIMLLEKEDE